MYNYDLETLQILEPRTRREKLALDYIKRLENYIETCMLTIFVLSFFLLMTIIVSIIFSVGKC